MADLHTVLYGEWKDGRRTPGIADFIEEAKRDRAIAADASKQAAIEARIGRERSDRNRTLLLTTLATAATGLALKIFELVAAAHPAGH